MKIAYIANTNSIHSYKWIRYFADKGHEINWYSLNKDTKFSINTDKVTTFSGGMKASLIPVHISQIFCPDIIHAHYAGWNGFIGAMCRRHPYIITVWGSDVIGNYNNIIKREVVKYGLNKADLVTCDAEHIMGYLSRYGVQPDKIKRINFGVDTEMFKPNKIAHKGKIVVSLRSLEKIYDIETLIRAVPYVVEEIEDAYFKIYGDGSQRKKLEKLANKLGVSDYVEFMGVAKYEDIPNILNSADLYVSTALSDAGIASSTAEAMACGIRVLITDIGDNKSWAYSLFNIKDYKTLADRIVMYLNSDIEYPQNREKIVKEDNYITEMEKMERLYETCLNNFKS